MATRKSRYVIEVDTKSGEVAVTRLTGKLRGLKGTASKGAGFGQLASAIGVGTLAASAAIGVFRSLTDTLRGVASAAFEAVKAFEDVEIALQATLAGQIKFSDDIAENFALAGEAAGVVVERLQELDRETAGTFQDLVEGFQAFASGGGLAMVETIEEGLQATKLLINATAVYDKQANQALSNLTNIRAVVSGTVSPQAKVAKILQDQTGPLEKQRKIWRDNLGALEGIAKAFPGVNQATEKLGNSWSGILTSVKTKRDIFLRGIFTKGLDEIKNKAIELLAAFQENRKVIGSFLEVLSRAFQAFATIAVKAFELIVKGLVALAESPAIHQIVSNLIFIQKLLEERPSGGAFDFFGIASAAREANEETARLFVQMRVNAARAGASTEGLSKALNDLLKMSLRGLVRETGAVADNLERAKVTLEALPRIFDFSLLGDPTPGAAAPPVGQDLGAGIVSNLVPQVDPNALNLPEGFLGLDTANLFEQLTPPPETFSVWAEFRTTMSETLEDLTGRFGLFAQGIGSVFAAIAQGVGAGEAFKRFGNLVIAELARMAAVKGAFELAQGFAALFLNPAKAAAHFKASAIFFGVAGAAAALGSATAPSRGGGRTGQGGFAGAVATPEPVELGSLSSSGQGSTSSGGFFGDTADSLGKAIRRLDDKISSMKPGDVLTVGARQRPGFISRTAFAENPAR